MYQYIGSGAVETQNTLAAYRHTGDFDVYHDHTVVGLSVAPFLSVPVVHTIHGAILPDIYGLYASLPPNVRLVSISQSQADTLPATAMSTLIYNAIDVEATPWCTATGDYLLFVGRAAPEKGPLEALRIAERAGLPLRMLLKVNEQPEVEYFDSLRPWLARPGVEVELAASETEKQAAYAGALATLFPVSWDEPFGLVMIESMAAGTPVIAYRRGSVPEVVEHGVTGFVCQDEDHAVDAVHLVRDIDRDACRSRARQLFDVSNALDRHERLYRALVGSRACAP
jgi:glycosyltransferase involved in cell wall biosynthesis